MVDWNLAHCFETRIETKRKTCRSCCSSVLVHTSSIHEIRSDDEVVRTKEVVGVTMEPTGTAELAKAWERLSKATSEAFRTLEEGEEPPPRPQEVEEWMIDTVHGMGLGMLVGWLRAEIQERRRPPDLIQSMDLDPMDGVPEGKRAAKEARWQFMRSMHRFSRVSGATVRGGLVFGSLSAIYTGCRALSGFSRDHQDAWNDAIAGATTGATVGAFAVRGLGSRAVASIGGLVTGGVIGYPIGSLRTYLESITGEEGNNGDGQDAAEEDANTTHPLRPRDAVLDTITQMESQLRMQRGKSGVPDPAIQERPQKRWWLLWLR